MRAAVAVALAGPKRYTDLRDGLPGLATDLLATRLRELQQTAVIDRREVPPPTPATVYELTARGHALKPAILEPVLGHISSFRGSRAS
jgi:DNA-binding HxlR family transcriptional regulator